MSKETEMTSERIRNVAHLVLAAATLIALAVATAEAQSRGPAAAALMVRADKPQYALGESVELSIEITNTSARDLAIPAEANVWTGYLEVLIAAADGSFLKYAGPGFGLRDSTAGSRILQRGQSANTTATVLFNHGVEVGHLSASARAAALQGRLPNTGFAFLAGGAYQMKARLYSLDFSEYIESQPIGIVVNEPQGTDRQVWNVLSRDPDFAYFLQAGGPKGHPSSQKSVALVSTLDALLDAYPTSRYAAAMKRALATNNARVEEARQHGLLP
jgi:hypothetical protein